MGDCEKMRYKYLILGAGPAGLTMANRLMQNGETSICVLEKERIAGGLCRSKIVDDAPLDIGGGHFLDTKHPDVNEFLFQYMPKAEWKEFDRDSRILLDGKEIGYPIESNIWQLEIEEQVDYLKSIAQAGCNIGEPIPVLFCDWINWKLGKKIAEKYMIPYNTKMFGENLGELGTYWLDKLPNVSFEQVVLSCLKRKAYGTQPGHVRFLYPIKYGYGELWARMADTIHEHIRYESQIISIDFDNRRVRTSMGEEYEGEYIITTIPWTSIETYRGVPDHIIDSISKLKHSSVEIRYFEDKIETKAHWLYVPDTDIPYHRILVRSNFSEGKGYWTETNSSRIESFDKEEKLYSHINEYAYPMNTINKPRIMEDILGFAKNHGIIGLGRWGEWQHYNSDVTVKKAIELADTMV